MIKSALLASSGSDIGAQRAQRNGSTWQRGRYGPARIGTILVVAPRKATSLQYANGTLVNTGNATLRILAYGPCLEAG